MKRAPCSAARSPRAAPGARPAARFPPQGRGRRRRGAKGGRCSPAGARLTPGRAGAPGEATRFSSRRRAGPFDPRYPGRFPGGDRAPTGRPSRRKPDPGASGSLPGASKRAGASSARPPSTRPTRLLSLPRARSRHFERRSRPRPPDGQPGPAPGAASRPAWRQRWTRDKWASGAAEGLPGPRPPSALHGGPVATCDQPRPTGSCPAPLAPCHRGIPRGEAASLRGSSSLGLCPCNRGTAESAPGHQSALPPDVSSYCSLPCCNVFFG